MGTPSTSAPDAGQQDFLPRAAATERDRWRARERTCTRVLGVIAAFVALGLAAHLVVLLWAQHDFNNQVEALVVLQSDMFAHGDGLYWGVNRYPYTVSAYGPVFYAATGYLHKWGVPAYQSGRLLSFAALLAALWLCWRVLGQLTSNTFARSSGVILAASTSNLLFWGSVVRADMLACCFSLAAFAAYLEFREQRDTKLLVLSGILVILAVFTKQTFLAAGAAIGLTLLWEDRKHAAWWIPAVSLAGGGMALALNAATHGGYFADAVLANINPFAWYKLAHHALYLTLTGTGVILIAAAGFGRASRRTAPLLIYAALASGVWLLTAPKVGSDLNYQIEMMLVLALCAACALDRLQFFPCLFSPRRAWIKLLLLPLLLHVAVNEWQISRVLSERVRLEPVKRRQTAALKPFVERPGRLLSMHYDSLLHYGARLEVEPLIFSLLVRAGLTDPTPVTRDLATRQFATVILAEDVFAPPPAAEDLEKGRLPEAQIQAIRNNYRLIQQVDGPTTVYIYEPRSD